MSSCSVAYWKFVEVDSGCSSAAAEQQQQPLSFLFVACRDHKLSWKLISCCGLSRWRWSVSQLPYDSCLLSAASCLFSLVCLPSSLPLCLCCRFVCCHRASYFSNSFQLVPLLSILVYLQLSTHLMMDHVARCRLLTNGWLLQAPEGCIYLYQEFSDDFLLRYLWSFLTSFFFLSGIILL